MPSRTTRQPGWYLVSYEFEGDELTEVAWCDGSDFYASLDLHGEGISRTDYEANELFRVIARMTPATHLPIAAANPAPATKPRRKTAAKKLRAE